MVTLYFPKGTVNADTGLVEEEREIEGSGPAVLEAHTVRYWCRHTKELKGQQVTKAELFVSYDCIQYLGEGAFVCLPLNSAEEFRIGQKIFTKKPYANDYNSSEYTIRRTGENTFECNCQGWQTRKRRSEIVPEGANCSHVLALFYAFKMKKFSPKSRTEGCLDGEDTRCVA